jgi:DNA-binding SARP family transcriptional activator
MDMPGPAAIESLIEEAPGLLAGGAGNVLEARINSLPLEVVEQNPWLLYYLGVCRMGQNLPEARGHFEKAFNQFSDVKDIPGTVLSWSGIVDTISNEWKDLRPIDRWVKWYDENLRDSIPAPFPNPDIEARLASTMVNAITYRLPTHPDGEAWLKRAYAVLESDYDVNGRIMLGASMAAYYCFSRGDAHRVIPIVDYLNKLTSLPGVSPLSRLIASMSVSTFQWLIKADPDACLDVASRGLKLGSQCGIHHFDHFFFAQGAHGAITAANTALASAHLAKMNAAIGGINRMDASNYHYLSAWLALLNGDAQAALLHSRNCLTLTEEVASPLTSVYGHYGMAHALFELGQFKQAIGHADEAIGISRENRVEGAEAMGHIFKSHFLLETGESAGGLEHLAAGLALWRKSGFLNFPYWLPSMMAGLFARALNAGIEAEFVRHVIKKRNLVPETPPYHCEGWPWRVRIKALGKLEILRDESKLKLTGKALGKPVRMLEAILSLGGRDVRADAVMDTLWPESEGDSAQRAFDTTLHRLRKFLGGNDTVLLKDGRVGLNELICYLDIWAVEHLLERAEEQLRGAGKDCESDVCCILEKALGLYKGPFLEGKNPEAFDRVQGKIFRLAEKVGDSYERSERIPEAVDLYRKVLETDVAAEEFYRRLMRCYQRLGRNSEAAAAYEHCRVALLSAYGIEPSRETEAIYKSALAIGKKPSLPVSGN